MRPLWHIYTLLGRISLVKDRNIMSTNIDPNNPDATESTHIDVQLNVHDVQPCFSVRSALIQGSLCGTLLKWFNVQVL